MKSHDAPNPNSEREIDVSANPSMTDLLAAVGRLLLCWGWLEGTGTLESRPIPNDLELVRKMRNAICHGMRSAYANPWEDATAAYIECRAQDETLVKYSFQDLHAAIRCLQKAGRPLD